MRVAWVMHLKPGQEAAYKKKHDEIWPELVELIKRDGIRNYSIYRHGLTLFAYYECDEPPPRGKARDEVRRRWHEWMAPHMETLEDDRPVSEALEEMFHLD